MLFLKGGRVFSAQLLGSLRASFMSDRRKDCPLVRCQNHVANLSDLLDINHFGQDIGANLATTKWELGELSFLITLWPGCARTVLPRRHPPNSAVPAVETGSHLSPGYCIKERGRTALVCAADCLEESQTEIRRGTLARHELAPFWGDLVSHARNRKLRYASPETIKWR